MTTPSSEPGPPAAARLFVGLWPDAGVREALCAQQDAWTWPAGSRPTPPERFHLTLHFLGAVARERVPALVQALGVPCEPFDLRLVRAELWPGGIAVLRPASTPPALQDLHARLGQALHALRQATARERLEPHVTLARRAQGALPPATMAALRWTVRGHVLVESGLAAQQRYRIVAEYR